MLEKSKHRLTELFHGTSAAALASTQLSNKVSKPWSISDLETLRNHVLTDLSASPAFALLQNEMSNLLLDFRKFDMLVTVEHSQVLKFLTSAVTRIGSHWHYLAGGQKQLPMSFVALFGSRLF